MIYNAVCWLLLGAGIFAGIGQQRVLAGKQIVEGRVTNLIPGRSSKGGVVYALEAAFNDAAGTRRTYRSSWNTANPGYRVADKIRLYYNPRNPSDCGLATFGGRFGVAWMLILTAFSLMIGKAGFAVGGARTNRTHAALGASSGGRSMQAQIARRGGTRARRRQSEEVIA
jgi:hypothetical protein